MFGRGIVRQMSSRVNRLASESSPYLQQHKHNPVDWYAWGGAAFEAARESNRPILLSIGYSTCHWCHVMERESFESYPVQGNSFLNMFREETAKIMNELFVNVKVDREERPDVDRQYMAFVQALTGGGGWPLTVFLTPDLIPFFGGTYYPPEDRYGQPGFPRLLRIIGSKWREDEAGLRAGGMQVVEAIQEGSKQMLSAPLPEDVVDGKIQAALLSAVDHYRQTYDGEWGGFGGAPKFPTPPILSLLLQSKGKAWDGSEMAVATLKAMSLGGIRDHLEGGFHRYSVDRRWHLPHFEKMLYDQGQLMSVLSTAYSLNPDPILKEAVHGIYEYVTRHLQHPDGLFYAAEDADSVASDGQMKEGAFAVWGMGEVREVLPEEDVELFCRRYGVKDGGNVDPSKDPHGDLANLNIIDRLMGTDDEGGHQLEVEERLAEARRLLGERRAARKRPSLDTKLLASWNGLMISGLCRAYRVFGLSPRYLLTAQQCASSLLSHLTTDGSNLQHTPSIDAFPEDYAYCIQAILDLYEAKMDTKYLQGAEKLQREMVVRFWDTEMGIFVGKDKEENGTGWRMPMRLVDDYDGVEPSANSVSIQNLCRLHLLTEDVTFHRKLRSILSAYTARLTSLPASMPALLASFTHLKHPPCLLTIEAAGMEEAEELKLVALSTYRPGLLIKAIYDKSTATPRAHICQGTTCSAIVTRPEDLAALLKDVK